MHLLRFFMLLFILKCFNAERNAKEILPTFLLDYEGAMRHIDHEANPFNKMESNNFADIIRSAIKRSEGVVIFVEESFSVEDVTIKDHLGTPFYHLRQKLLENKVFYFPSVINPYKTLNRMIQQKTNNVFYLNIGSKLELPENFKHIYVFFENGVNETLVERLRKHDMIIMEVYFAVRRTKPGPVVAFYTGKSGPLVERTQFVPIKPIAVPRQTDVVILTEGALFRFSGVYATTGARRAMFSQIPLIAKETWTRRKLSTKMAYTDFELQFNFNLEDANWWKLETVSLLEGGEEVGISVLHATAPWNNSYVCGEPIVVINMRDGSSVTISKYQIQPLRPFSTVFRNGTGGNVSTSFGPTVSCGPYFNIHILSGLMVTVACLIILAVGLSALYNCSSNNKFDDPSGKQLVHEIN